MKRIIVLIGMMSIFSSCKEFIESSVKDKKVRLLAPGDSVQTNNYNQTFWWEPVEDASSYRLQIVSPSFDSIVSLVTDTVLNTDKFQFTLEPGTYQWRVRAENGSSQSLYTTRSLTIFSSTIAEQHVQVISPSNNLLTNEADITYRWNKLFGATQYRLQIDTNNFADTTKLLYDQTTVNSEFKVPLSKEKVHQWRVRAENDSLKSRWSAIYRLTFDATPPEKVVLSSPTTNESVTKPVNLKWEAVAGAGKYELIVLKSDSSSVYNATFPKVLTATSFSFNEGTTNEKLYWKVRAIDEAGNKGIFSEVRSFTVQ
ncbi:hypothetical protein [Rubrolithibacter danxiaensis]|uniref:hypothetical protein n=1 Tax=Rubrolithibacter danxiaensis TaxID=3390805 RepID=UPI003BF8DA06